MSEPELEGNSDLTLALGGSLLLVLSLKGWKEKDKDVFTYILHAILYILQYNYIYVSILYNFNILKRARTHRLHGVEKANCPQTSEGLLCCYFKEHCVSFAWHL